MKRKLIVTLFLAATLITGCGNSESISNNNTNDNTICFTDSVNDSDIYYKLYMEKQLEGNYNATISIFRIATLEGIAVDNGDGTYSFTDDCYGVKGIIKIENDDTAKFTITESSFDYLEVGEEYSFNYNHSDEM